MDKMYSIFDEKAQVFNTPFACRNEAIAIRSFTDICSERGGMVSKYPEDFKLYYLGDFDDLKGTISALDIPMFVVSAMQILSSRLVSPKENDDNELAERLHV